MNIKIEKVDGLKYAVVQLVAGAKTKRHKAVAYKHQKQNTPEIKDSPFGDKVLCLFKKRNHGCWLLRVLQIKRNKYLLLPYFVTGRF